jgi:hypothetical protein
MGHHGLGLGSARESDLFISCHTLGTGLINNQLRILFAQCLELLIGFEVDFQSGKLISGYIASNVSFLFPRLEIIKRAVSLRRITQSLPRSILNLVDFMKEHFTSRIYEVYYIDIYILQ